MNTRHDAGPGKTDNLDTEPELSGIYSSQSTVGTNSSPANHNIMWNANDNYLVIVYISIPSSV